MLALIGLYALVGMVVLVAAPVLRRGGYLLAAVPMVATIGHLAWRWDEIVSGEVAYASVSWIPTLDLVIDARVDGFSALMALLVAGVGTLVVAYASSYFDEGTLGLRSAGLLVLFAGSMLGLVTADHLIWLFVCWELTSITSYLLIGGNQSSPDQRWAALQALLVTGAGGLSMLAGFVVIAQDAGTWSLHEILTVPPTGGSTGIGLGLVLVGIITKSALYPFHFWLPGAMVAPTPISAYLHSATMVKAGIYLAARLGPAFADTGIWRPVVVSLGLTTMVAGALRALRQNDLKLLLAHGTVSQLGFMFVLAASGTPYATEAACLLILAHGLFKGALFLVVGIVDHECGTRDRRRIPELGQGWTAVRVVALISAASMAGIPPLTGFAAKESAYDAFTHGGWETVTLVGIVAGSILTFAYSARFARSFLPSRSRTESTPHAPHWWFTLPAVVLGVGTVVTGVAVGPTLTSLVSAASSSLDSHAGGHGLSLWHGVNAALTLSAVTIALGAVLAVRHRQVERMQERLSPSLRADAGLGVAIRGLNSVARRVTGFVQSGSLSTYIAVILLVVFSLPVIALLSFGSGLDWPGFAEVPSQAVLALVLAGAGLAVATARRRFAAVLMLGAVGYAMALLFALHGAADLAFTQFAVETLSVVVFMLVIRHLPTRFRSQPLHQTPVVRIAVSVMVAVGVFLLAIGTNSADRSHEVSDQIIASSEPEGGGKNVVNVILVDVRGLDTLGEVSVLTVAAVGVVAIARVGRRARRRDAT